MLGCIRNRRLIKYIHKVMHFYLLYHKLEESIKQNVLLLSFLRVCYFVVCFNSNSHEFLLYLLIYLKLVVLHSFIFVSIVMIK